jgi:hypothetical protein
MQSVVRVITLAIFMLVGCMDTLPPDEDEASDTGEQEVRFPVAPQDSCALKLPLSCPSTAWQVTYKNSLITESTTSATFNRGSVAGFTAGAERELCTANQDIVIAGVAQYGAFMPAGVTAEISPDRKSVQFKGGVVPNNLLIPAKTGPVGVCSLMCDRSAQSTPGCRRNPPGPETVAVSAPGRAYNAQAVGTVDTLTVNAATGEMHMTCKWTIPRAGLTTTPSRRPDDVIATSNGSFLRGYSLSGASLDNACQRIAADFLCSPGNPSDGTDTSGPYQECIDTTSASCRSVFRGPDPCACAIARCLRNSDCASNSCSATGCCLPVIR